jgi:pimeloyl-ACP methyl ester carboxylesterase
VKRRTTRALTTSLAIALIAASTPTMSQMEPYLHPQRLVDIGSRRLNVYCTGSGSPTVVLDAGWGDTSEIWYKVQGPIAERTRVCSYDRAGMGFSDGATSKRDAWSVVSDLHALLHGAGIEPPYVLVAHSIAGLYAPLFADRYPSEVAGMVLVDPTPPYVDQREASVAPAVSKLVSGQEAFARACDSAARSGRLEPGDKAYAECLGTVAQQRASCLKDGPALCAVDKVQLAQQLRPAFWYDGLSELDSIEGADSAQAQRDERTYGALPLIVLTAADTFNQPGIPRAQQLAAWRMWNAMHDELAKYSSLGVNFVVRDSGHYIQLQRPAVVISAVDEVVDQARAKR